MSSIGARNKFVTFYKKSYGEFKITYFYVLAHINVKREDPDVADPYQIKLVDKC